MKKERGEKRKNKEEKKKRQHVSVSLYVRIKFPNYENMHSWLFSTKIDVRTLVGILKDRNECTYITTRQFTVILCSKRYKSNQLLCALDTLSLNCK